MDLGEWLWAMVAFFFWFMAIWIFIQIFADIFGRREKVVFCSDLARC